MTSLHHLLCRCGRQGLRLLRRLALLALTLGAVVAVALWPRAPEPESGWGAEVLTTVQESARALSPIGLANACGLGASSCFKCHNGTRAELPQTAPDQAPWHAQHASVNYSCAGCHQGNPRIIRQDIAHKGLLANPLSAPAQACARCHGDADVDALADRYLSGHPHLSGGTP